MQVVLLVNPVCSKRVPRNLLMAELTSESYHESESDGNYGEVLSKYSHEL